MSNIVKNTPATPLRANVHHGSRWQPASSRLAAGRLITSQVAANRKAAAEEAASRKTTAREADAQVTAARWMKPDSEPGRKRLSSAMCVGVLALTLGCSPTDGASGEAETLGDETPSGDAPGAGTSGPGPDQTLNPATPGAEPAEQPTLITEMDPPESVAPGPLKPGADCAAISEQATRQLRPQDIVVVVDTSSSMDDVIVAIQDRLNGDLAEVLEASGIDYRVVLLASYGDVSDSNNLGICIASPLGGHDCAAGSPFAMTAGPRFVHHNIEIASLDSWCQIVDEFDSWQVSLRPEAFKSFILFTDDHQNCDFAPNLPDFTRGDWEDQVENGAAVGVAEELALAFDQVLQGLSPEHFGTAAERNYRFHSVVGMQEKAAASDTPYTALEPIVVDQCKYDEGNHAGLAYQQLSALTEGLRYPICENDSFDSIFRAASAGIVEAAGLSCDWGIPAVPAGQVFDRDKVNVRYIGPDGTATDLNRVNTLAECRGQGGWFYDNPTTPTRVLTCPSSCDLLETTNGGSVEVLFGCQTRIADPR